MLLCAAALVFVAARPEEPPPSSFPSPERLEDLRETPLPEGVFDRPMAAVERWTLAGPFPDTLGASPYRDPSNWGALLDDAAARRAGLVVSTEAMHCTAREWGLFHLAHRAPPTADLAEYLSARCSTVSPAVSYFHFDGGVPDAASDDEIFEAWRPAVDAILGERLVGGPLTAGIWFGRKDGHAIAVVAVGERRVRLDPLATLLEEGDGTFRVSGELLVPAQGISAAVNHGAFDAVECERAPVALPRFAFRCRVDRRDAQSWLSVALTPPGRLLAAAAVRAVLWPSGESTAEWTRPTTGTPSPVGEDTDLAAELLARINGVRERAGRRPLVAARAQSEEARELAPYYFASVFGVGGPDVGELIVLGMLAGWRVDGVVQGGDFTSAWVTRSNDLDHLVATALRYPAGRRALLDPQAQQLAVGALAHAEGGVLAGLFATYALFDEASHDATARQILEALDAARAAAGKAPARHLTKVAALSRLSAQRIQGGETPEDVLGDLMRQCSRVLDRSVNGWVIEANDPAETRFPQALLEADVLELAIGVSHHKPEGEPWARWVILLVSAGPEGRGA